MEFADDFKNLKKHATIFAKIKDRMAECGVQREVEEIKNRVNRIRLSVITTSLNQNQVSKICLYIEMYYHGNTFKVHL